jgi:glycosyltransferase involved in cell wall biosynthesis
MKIIVDLNFSVPIWRFFYLGDDTYQIPYEFIYKDKKYTNGICIIQLTWDIDEGILESNTLFDETLLLQNTRNVIICAPTLKILELFKKYRPNLRICLANHNAFIDESVYKIDYTVEPTFDLVVSSCFCKYKNLHLVKDINNNVCSIGYFQGSDTSEILEINKENFYFANFKENKVKTRENFLWIDPPTSRKYYNMSKIGGIFSTTEGACFSSSEYLLCGLPVLSCKCSGGREIWYNDENSVLCDPNEESVSSSLNLMIDKYNSGGYDREKIRQQHIEQMDIHRNNLTNEVIKLLQIITPDIPPFDELKDSLKHYHSNCCDNYDEVSINYKNQIFKESLAREILGI